MCVEAYHEAMAKTSLNLDSDEESDLIANPVRYQMWHHTFDPHTQVPRVKLADLKPPPQMVRSSAIGDFLVRSSMPALVEDAIAKATHPDTNVKMK